MVISMRFQKVVSGGQTGADQAGLRAAKAAEIETGGWAAKGWATEEGRAPWLAQFGLAECPKPGYPARTDANARDSDGTVWFATTESSGYQATAKACRKHRKPLLIVKAGETRPSHVLEWAERSSVAVLNVAGNRESASPEIGKRVEVFLSAVFKAA